MEEEPFLFMPSRLLEKMNPQQQEGIQAVDGPVLLLAGAGSGKTRVITHRIAYLIEERGVPADQILAVTFTNKAAAEMAERVEKIIGHSSLAKPTLSTFHSFCVRVLRRDIEALKVNGKGLTRTFAIYDETDQQAVVKSALKRLGIDDKTLKPRVALGRISWAKNHMIDPQEYFLASTNPLEEKIAHIFKIYRDELAKANALDFDDLLLETVRLLKVSAETREKYNRRYRYVMIDEYQDTNKPQYELMKLLAGDHHNVCVVGDEDQSIYSWRGADIKNILDFEKDFPEVRVIRLEQNYRSTQIILEGASAVVAQNTQRKGKNLWTSREGGSLIGLYEAPDGENEALFIADRIQRYLRAAGESEELPRCAVLYRTNSQSRLVEEALRRYQIQYHMVGGFSFYDRAEIKDILSYMKLVQNPHDSIALGRSINSPPRGIGKTTMETLERMALSTGMSTWDAIGRAIEDRLLPARALLALSGFKRLIEDARAMLGPGFAEKLAEDVAPEEITVADDSFDPEAFATEAVTETAVADSPFDTSFNFGFDFGPSEEISTIAPENALDSDAAHGIDAAMYNPFAPVVLKSSASGASEAARRAVATEAAAEPERPAFRKPGDAATLPELIKFLNDRSGYIRALEEEATPESFSRIENLKELANAAQDAQERGETLARVPGPRRTGKRCRPVLGRGARDADDASRRQGPGVSSGLPRRHGGGSLSALAHPHRPDRSRRRTSSLLRGHDARHGYPGDDPRPLPPPLRQRHAGAVGGLALSGGSAFAAGGGPWQPAERVRSFRASPAMLMRHPIRSAAASGSSDRSGGGERHYDYEDESQESGVRAAARAALGRPAGQQTPGKSMDNIATFFAGRGMAVGTKFSRPKLDIPAPTGKTGLGKGARVRHPKYGDGVVFQREGDGDDAKITVQFQQHGVKKLVEKFAQLQKL